MGEVVKVMSIAEKVDDMIVVRMRWGFARNYALSYVFTRKGVVADLVSLEESFQIRKSPRLQPCLMG